MSDYPFDLTPHNSYRLRAFAKQGLLPKTAVELVEALRGCPDAIVLGSGHNVILSKERYDEAFVFIDVEGVNQVRVDGEQLGAFAGVGMKALSILAREQGLSGMEVFYDIPSSLGGAVVMNAGASGEELSNVLVSVTAYDRTTGLVRKYAVDELEYGYRKSLFQRCPNLIVVEAEIRLRPGDPLVIQQNMEEIKRQRWEKQPRDLPNAGSVFRRPPGYFVGAMLDELALRGLRVGGAQVSTKHSGFIVNAGNATGADILGLIELVTARVRDHFGVSLVREQIII